MAGGPFGIGGGDYGSGSTGFGPRIGYSGPGNEVHIAPTHDEQFQQFLGLTGLTPIKIEQ
jgi:hypothetical protein